MKKKLNSESCIIWYIFLLTCPGSIGANQAWRPSLVLFIPSISLSGVRMSLFMPSIILTLSGNAAISIKEKPTKIRNKLRIYWWKLCTYLKDI